MEYSESVVRGGFTEQVICSRCGSKHHSIKGVIKYGFFFLESIPFFPIKKTAVIECTQCHQLADNTQLSAEQLKSINKATFKFYHFISKFTGVYLMLALMGYFYIANIQKDVESQHYVEAPKVNDFYFIDFRKMAKNLRPNQKYIIAKVVDITGDTVSIVYGSVFYVFQRSLESSIRKSRAVTSNYFARKRNEFNFEQIKKLYSSGAILRAMRPVDNKLFDSFVISSPAKTRRGNTYYPGAIENTSGQAFLAMTYLDKYEQQAFDKFKLAAKYGYAQGQINLAELYLTGRFGDNDGFEKALYWLQQAALQSDKKAIDKYLIICNKASDCDVDAFYKVLTDEGVNYRFDR
ncbi:MAG: sel1 repeat family protein [Colwellia sp.]|nr:sel1 repeat family protein [Colwellia sp.]